MVLDERRQRDNRRECFCCLTRKNDYEENEEGFEEGIMSKYFRKYHAPAILSTIGKILVSVVFAGLLGFGVWVRYSNFTMSSVRFQLRSTKQNFFYRVQ